MKRAKLFILVLLLNANSLLAQFASQAGLPGSTAIHAGSNVFKAWGDSCQIERGWMNIADTTLGRVWFGNDINVKSIADGNVVSLGDGGRATYYFEKPVYNGSGADFVIFENGFRDPADSTEAYLEFAHVEVSSDGINFIRFASISHLDTTAQIAGTGEYVNTEKIHNLAGKYVAMWGTPFDLEEVKDEPGLDVQQIHFIRIIDVTGSILPGFNQRDSEGRIINDPFPTDFPTGGFDLDAIGIIHTHYPLQTDVITPIDDLVVLSPNPSSDYIHIQCHDEYTKINIYSVDGRLLKSLPYSSKIDISQLASGIYCICLTNDLAFTRKMFYKW